jgi:hypothetical protein
MMMDGELKGFKKDEKTGAYINIDEAAYQQHLAAREKSKRESVLQSRLSDLEDDIKDIKSLILQIVNERKQ